MLLSEHVIQVFFCIGWESYTLNRVDKQLSPFFPLSLHIIITTFTIIIIIYLRILSFPWPELECCLLVVGHMRGIDYMVLILFPF